MLSVGRTLTERISTSFSNKLAIFCASSTPPSMTMVNRETSGLLVLPTVSESIWKSLRRRSPEILESTPGLFWAKTERMFFFIGLNVGGFGLYLLFFGEQRVAEMGSGWHHGEYVGFACDDKFAKNRTLVGLHFL